MIAEEATPTNPEHDALMRIAGCYDAVLLNEVGCNEIVD